MKRNVIGLLLTLTMLIGMIPLGGPLNVSAEDTELPTVAIGEIWTATWTMEDNFAAANLAITESGFYEMDIYGLTNSGGQLYVQIYNITQDEYVNTIYGENLYTQKNVQFYLSAEYEYGILAFSVLQNQFDAGSVHIILNRSQDAVTEVVLDTPLNVSYDNSEEQCVFFTTSVAGDYRLTLSKRHLIHTAVYNGTTGQAIIRQTQATDEYSLAPQAADSIVVRLEADTTYYMYIRNSTYGFNGTLTLSKCEKELDTIVLNKENNLLKYRKVSEENAETWYDYRVIYTDGTEEICSYSRIGHLGYVPPEVYMLGKQIAVFDTTYFSGATQPILCDYNGNYSYGTVRSLEKIGRGNDANEHHSVRSSNNTAEITAFDFTMTKTGVYKLYTNDLDAFDLDSFSYLLLDQSFNPVHYDDAKGGYPMVAGHNYRLYLQYVSVRDASIWLTDTNTVLFPDTHPSAWYYNAVTYAVGSGIMTGYQNGRFGTSDAIQRQDFLLMLARLDGVNLDDYKGIHGTFPDVAANSYYEAAVNWGHSNGIVTGYNNGCFGVGDKITREQLVTFLYRYAKYRYPDVTFDENAVDRLNETYRDFSRVSAFAKDPMIWALENGVIKGKNATSIVPQGNAQRCEVAQTMYNIFANSLF